MITELRASTLPNKRERFELPEKVMANALKKIVGAPKEAWIFERLLPHEVEKKCSCFQCTWSNHPVVKNSRIDPISRGWTWKCYQARNAHIFPKDGSIYVIGTMDDMEEEILKWGLKLENDRAYMMWASDIFWDMAKARIQNDQS